jgi:transcriptional regulator with PAS, ATPase and Fis domain
MIADIAAAPSIDEGLQLILDTISTLGVTAESVTMARADQTMQAGSKTKAAGVRREIVGRFNNVTISITCLGAMTPELSAHIQTIASVAALSAERWSRKTWQPDLESSPTQGMLGNSPRMKELNEEIKRASRSLHNVLIKGESGSGKTTAASSIHNQSTRGDKPFVDANCANFQESLLESELFGYEKGAYTGAAGQKKGLFEQAEGGTLFLDEIAEMKPELQAKFLKAIEQKKFRRLGGTKDITCDVRIIAATSRNLPEMIKEGTFREDLYYRLAVLEVHAAPLREKREDVPMLILRCFEDERKLAGRAEAFQIEEAAVAQLVSYDWPGNIRQLQNIVARLASCVEDDAVITLEDVRRTLAQQLGATPGSGGETSESGVGKGADGSIMLPQDLHILKAGESLNDFIDRVEQTAIETTRALEGSITAAATRLRITRGTLLTKRKRLIHRLSKNQPDEATQVVKNKAGNAKSSVLAA